MTTLQAVLPSLQLLCAIHKENRGPQAVHLLPAHSQNPVITTASNGSPRKGGPDSFNIHSLLVPVLHPLNKHSPRTSVPGTIPGTTHDKTQHISKSNKHPPNMKLTFRWKIRPLLHAFLLPLEVLFPPPAQLAAYIWLPRVPSPVLIPSQSRFPAKTHLELLVHSRVQGNENNS